ncbi:type II secretion system protein J [Demequina sp. NBRC 110057]|uniref:PulJ/GspJ family protein n=1 Tax=Demequina sp. NBRC 110057 TaxID=1570346 RepID=UPI000A06510A|nr:type II secretion system protein [Demequina sp. NBRC 110057]
MPARRPGRDAEAGYTLTELLIAMAIFSGLMVMIFSLMITMMHQAEDNLGRTRAVEQARLGISQIDRQIRSGNVIIDPASDGLTESGVAQNYSLRVFTQENGEDKCVQWRVAFPSASARFGDLEYREWDAGDPTTATTWSVVASNVVRPSVSPVDANVEESWPPFWTDPRLPTGTRAQNVRITLRLSDPSANEDAKPASVTSVVTGRNTVFGYSPDYCSAIPAP